MGKAVILWFRCVPTGGIAVLWMLGFLHKNNLDEHVIEALARVDYSDTRG